MAQKRVQLNGAVKVFCGAVEDAVKSKAVLMKWTCDAGKEVAHLTQPFFAPLFVTVYKIYCGIIEVKKNIKNFAFAVAAGRIWLRQLVYLGEANLSRRFALTVA
ncbi:MAG: hypothetical protein LBC70_01210 [Chitinispirillales bacterium]|nr:hypothetical protein [Chitinispirillales bacterium]